MLTGKAALKRGYARNFAAYICRPLEQKLRLRGADNASTMGSQCVDTWDISIRRIDPSDCFMALVRNMSG